MAAESSTPSTPAPAASTPAPAQIPAGETAASMASVAAGAQKLQEMLSAPKSNWITPTPAAKMVASPPPVNAEMKAANDEKTAQAKQVESARVAALTDEQRRFEQVDARRLEITKKLTDRDAKLSAQERAGLTDELRRLVAGQVSQQEREEMLDTLSTAEWRERFGVKSEVQPHLLEFWDEDAEAEVLESFSYDGATPEQTQAVMSWYAAKFNQLGGQVENLTPELEVEFRSLAKRVGLSQRLTDALVANEKQRISGAS
jgi:hypothetical protein